MSEATALKFSDAERGVLRERYKKLTEQEFQAFLDAARRYQLNPLANHIYARLQEQTQRNPRAVTYTAQIDGYRLIADRTGTYAGNDDPVYDDERKPNKATVAVYKIVAGQKCKFEASARWDQYCPAGPGDFMWKRMPHLMLGKCAEALALRKAFPAELAGLYTVEEMEQADSPPPASQSAAGIVEQNPWRQDQQPEAETEKKRAARPKGKGKPPVKESEPAKPKTAAEFIAGTKKPEELWTLLQKLKKQSPIEAKLQGWIDIHRDAAAHLCAQGWKGKSAESLESLLHAIGDEISAAEEAAQTNSEGKNAK